MVFKDLIHNKNFCQTEKCGMNTKRKDGYLMYNIEVKPTKCRYENVLEFTQF